MIEHLSAGVRRAFAEAWPQAPIVQQAAAQIPGCHNCLILERIKNPERRARLIQQTVMNGWSRNVPAKPIESRLHERLGAAHANFAATLPASQSDLARELRKDPYHFGFLSLGQEALEQEPGGLEE